VADVILHRLSGSKKALDACRLIEGLYLAGKRVVVYCADGGRASILDSYLWTFAQQSFVPHAIWNGESDVEEPVVLVTGAPVNPNAATVLVVADRLDDPRSAADFSEIHDLATRGAGDAGKAEAWSAAGFTVKDVVGVPARRG
jgi:DNA polymerase IIIc chi subunit